MGARALLGKAGYGLGCIAASVVLVVAGVGYYAQSKAESVGQSSVLQGGPSTGPMNILVMGLESRTYWSGKPLPHSLEDVMHIGSTGGNATNTLILIHIFPGGQQAVGFSIPRDSYVQMYGTLGFGPQYSKIDNAYGYAMAARIGYLQQKDPKMPSWEQNFEGNEAGRAATVSTVEHLTGQKIDHFAELNLDGFYQLAQQFGGIEVCVKPYNGGTNLKDANSGANLAVGYQHLNAAQALSFVRERDNLPQGDLDRTARQQAVLDYVLWKLRNDGLLTDVSRLNSLLSFAGNYLITSKGWNLLQFAGEMDALSGANLTFFTTKITGEPYVAGIGDVDSVDPPAIQATITAAFATAPPLKGAKPTPTISGSATSKPATTKPPSSTPKPTVSVPPASTVTVDVYNAGAPSGTGGRVSQALVGKGYQAGVTTNAEYPQSATTVSYGTGASANAGLIAKDFGVTATASTDVAAGHVQVVVGSTVTSLPAALTGTASPGGSSSSAGTPKPTAAPTQSGIANSEGGSVSVTAKAKYGIPCVY
ncbi:MAG TPA: LCP family protein [Trebonia sp.]|jgi:LCP family protein required for cell wall assembly|nr:LCP family protein [Trebonia sp.]